MSRDIKTPSFDYRNMANNTIETQDRETRKVETARPSL